MDIGFSTTTLPSTCGNLEIERDGRVVLNVCDPDREFASWVIAMVDELNSIPLWQLTQREMEWMKAFDRALGGQVCHA